MSKNNIAKNFYASREACRKAKKAYAEQIVLAREILVGALPKDCDQGFTASELSAQYGINRYDIARILADYACGKKSVNKCYVLLNDDGTIDYEHKIRKTYRLNIYCRKS